ncbi:uncharacterized protein N7479_008545 [Penicillium vulpinum]|uniref:Uncharacterized protein n=1 Tax=Penicillium vulpinum TaxID=29845 RepID=A0A1V6R740_9EURO|nr:uncharacterized protein N7479_008545 [Penicillium vulpinum]KAJ5950132.1 hypothetical protein N7479_008545 [Penicillium vulpinum]OQD97006.1 hypothetical protein PENVUL_c086G02583 [Penicillium vulpinum]
MDKISDLASKIGGGKGQEFVDKGLGAAEKKFGGNDPAKKVTDTGREQLEKTGKSIPDKFSH